jgi:hypothetical protein
LTVADSPRSTGFSLRRWSQRKLAAGRVERDAPGVAPTPDDGPNAHAVRPPVERAHAASAATSVESTHAASATPDTAPAAHVTSGELSTVPAMRQPAVALPAIESLTIDSDFSAFMQPGVDENVKRLALRKLLRHPRFNVMDGLDVYIDDYSKPSPIEPALVRTLVQARYIFDPPKTRVTPEGTVEDVPDEAVADAADAKTPDGDAASAPAIAEATGAPPQTPRPSHARETAEAKPAPAGAEDAS